MLLLWILLGVAVLVAGYVIVTYNRLIASKNHAEEAWSDIQVQMKRRYNLIPNLVETVKGYAGHERGTLEDVVKARNLAAANEGSPEEQAASENLLSGALRHLFAVAEDYPELKADSSFLNLQNELEEAENLIQKARRYYNGHVRLLNTMIESFPSNLVANAFKFLKAQFFELDEADAAARQPPKVDFS